MNYQQTYDPMQASAMRQQQNLGLAQSIKGGLGAIQQGLNENAAWKKFKANSKADAETKAKYWDAVTSSLQEAGLDVSKFPELSNAPALLADERVTPEKFAEMITKPLVSAKETIMGKKSIAEQSPEARDSMSQIKGIPGADAMTPTTQPQSSFVGPPTPADVSSSFVGPQLPQTAPSDSMIGATEPLPAYTEPDLTPEQLQHKNVIAQQRAMIKMFQAKADAGSLDTGDAAKFTTDMMALSAKDKDIEIEKLKIERQNAAKDKTQSADDVIDFAKNNFPLYDARTGKKIDQVDVADVRANPQNYSTKPTGKVFAPERDNYYGGGVGSSDTELKLRDSVRKDLESLHKDFTTKKQQNPDTGLDEYVKVPIPGTAADKILNTRDGWERFVWENYPSHAQRFGYKKPTAQGNDPLGIR